jgi:hypothetical protein
VPSSRSRLDRLGEKLAREGLTDDEQAEIDEFRDSHDAAIVEVQRALAELGYESTARLKNLGTIAEKLSREHTRLTTIEDIAGARLVIDGGRFEQDQAVEQIVNRFPGARVKDRRVQPSHGYRAVHVIVDVNGRRVEIQVRTAGQDQWAQIAERLGDRWGRQIRYGQPPDHPDRPVGVGSVYTRVQMCDFVQRLADSLDKHEDNDQRLTRLESEIGKLRPDEVPRTFREALRDARREQAKIGLEQTIADMMQLLRDLPEDDS